MKAFSKWSSGIALLAVVFVACLAGCCLGGADGNGDDVVDSLSASRVQPGPASDQTAADEPATPMRN